MQDFINSISIKVNENLYLKDPESTDLGKDIIKESIELFLEIGFEDFTFKKLAAKIQTTESSVYRYFENKHKLLLYLENWFWHWLEYYLMFSTMEISDPKEKLKKAVNLVDGNIEYDHAFQHIDEKKLYILVSSGLNRSFYTKDLESERESGFFAGFVNFSTRFSSFISAVNPDYNNPKLLSSTIIETIFYKKFISKNFPSLNDFKNSENTFVFNLIEGVLLNGKD